MEIRWLNLEEVEALVNPDLKKHNWAELNLNDAQPTCRVLGLFVDGVLIESFTFQMYPCLGPILKHVELKDSGGVSRQLAAVMEEWLESCSVRGYMTVASTPLVERLCKRFGMHKIEHPVYQYVRRDEL